MVSWALFVGFFKVGLFGFGAGPGMIPLIQAESVRAGWTTEAQFLEALAAGNVLPGPISIKLAVWIGWQQAGLAGASAALAGVLAPAVLLMLGLTVLFDRIRHQPGVAGAIRATGPAVVGMLAWTAWDLAPSAVRDVSTFAIAAAAFVALVLRVHPALVVVAAMALGAVLYRG